MAKTSEKQVTSIGVGFVFGWLLSLICLYYAFNMLTNASIGGTITFLLAGLSINPTFWSFSRSKFNFQLSGLLKIIVFILLLMAASFFYQQ